jgi:hypothetical protein
MFSMKQQKAQPSKSYLKLHREYRLYYLLAVLYGSRKQIFITFAPWVLVNVLDQPTQILAQLFFIGGVIGIVFQPLVGLDNRPHGRALCTGIRSSCVDFR